LQEGSRKVSDVANVLRASDGKQAAMRHQKIRDLISQFAPSNSQHHGGAYTTGA